MEENIPEVSGDKMEQLEEMLIDRTILNLGPKGSLADAEPCFNMLIRLLEAKAALVNAYAQM